MARSFRPSAPFTVAMKLLEPQETNVSGVTKKTFPDPDDVNEIFFASFRTFGGTENIQNGVYTLIDTATINTWYNPQIKANCRVYALETGQSYEIIGEPENIDMRHQYMQFKVKKVGGKP